MPQTTAPSSSPSPPVRYKIFVQVPFPRGDFVDPPDPRWNAAKDKELWRILSSTSKGRETDWHGLADKFGVTLPFLLQQAAWLYDRQLTQVRDQLRRVNKPSPAPTAAATATTTAAAAAAAAAVAMPPPPLPDSTGTSAVGSQPMRRFDSAASGARVSSNLSIRPRTSLDSNKDSAMAASPISERPQRAPFSRQASNNTIRQSQRSAFAADADRDRLQSEKAYAAHSQEPHSRSTATSPKASPSPPDSSSDDDDGKDGDYGAGKRLGYSRAFSHRPQFTRVAGNGKLKSGRLSSVASEDVDDSSDSDDDGFLPFASTTQYQGGPSEAKSRAQEMNQNLHVRTGTATQTARPRLPRPYAAPTEDVTRQNVSALSSSPSGNSSAQLDSESASQPSLGGGADRSHRSPLNALSPKQRRSVVKNGSDTGTPSMGSSFSDLDDASVNTSAMEEALATQLRAGGMGAASALRSSLAIGGRLGGLWRGNQGGQGQGHGQGQGQGPHQ